VVAPAAISPRLVLGHLTGMGDKGIGTFSEFWPFYLGEHSLPATRTMHVVGSWIALGNLLAAAVMLRPWYLLGAVLSGYAFAWVSHLFVEKNRPATFTYPLWSVAADWKMWAFILTGRIDAELQKHGVQPKKTGTPIAAS
jgi:hypothetical protein